MRHDAASLMDLLTKVWDYPLLTLGGGTLTIAVITKFVIGIILVWLVAWLIQRRLVLRILRYSVTDSGTRFAVSRIAYYVVFVLGVLVVLDATGVKLSSLAFIGGVVGIGIGFGMQNIASNFVSGIILLIERPISVGDVVTVGGTMTGLMGTVKEINIRVTRVLSSDNVTLYVPNSRFMNDIVINWTAGDEPLRAQIDVSAPNTFDPKGVRDLLMEAMESNPRVLRDPAPVVRLADFTDSAARYQALFWLPDITSYREVPSDVRFAMLDLLHEHGIVATAPLPARPAAAQA